MSKHQERKKERKGWRIMICVFGGGISYWSILQRMHSERSPEVIKSEVIRTWYNYYCALLILFSHGNSSFFFFRSRTSNSCSNLINLHRLVVMFIVGSPFLELLTIGSTRNLNLVVEPGSPLTFGCVLHLFKNFEFAFSSRLDQFTPNPH